MTVYICGGSNSIMKDGWTLNFSETDIGMRIVNISIGDTHSITGMYRAMFTADLQPGDVLLWEYCLNDVGQLKRSDIAPSVLLAQMEIFLTYLARVGVRFGALLLTNRENAVQNQDPIYRQMLRELLKRWQVPYLDVNAEYSAANGGAPVGARFYRDRVHYAAGTPLMAFLARKNVEFCASTRVPTPVARQYAGRGRGVSLLQNWSGQDPEETGTKIVRLKAYPPNAGLQLAPDCAGELLVVGLFSKADGRGIKLISGEQSLNIAGHYRAGPKALQENKTRFTTVYCRDGAAAPIRIEPETVVKVSRLRAGPVEGLIRLGKKVPLRMRLTPGMGVRVHGLMIERDGGLGAS